MLAVLVVILTTAATAAPSWVWNRREEAGVSLVHVCPRREKGQNGPCPGRPHVPLLEPDLFRLLQAASFCRAAETTSIFLQPQPATRDLRSLRAWREGSPVIWSGLVRAAYFYQEQLDSVRSMWGLCDEEEQVTGKQPPFWGEGPSAPKHGQDLGLHVQVCWAWLSCSSLMEVYKW